MINLLIKKQKNMETNNSNFAGLMLVIGKIATDISNDTKGLTPDKMQEAKTAAARKSVFKNSEEGLKLLSQGLVNPTPNDLSLLSLQTNVIISLIKMANPEKDADDLEKIRVQIQNYAKFKAEAMDNSEKLVAYIESNIALK